MRKALRITLWVLGSIFFLLFAIVIFINTDPGKEFIRKRTVAFLQQRLKTEVRIDSLDYDLPNMVELKGVLIRDQKKDTLLSAGELRVDISLLELLSSNVDIRKVYLSDAYSHIYRVAPDTAFNFDFVVKAFVSKGTDTTGAVTDTAASMQLNLDELVLNKVRFRMNDFTGGSRFYFDVGDLVLTTKDLDLDSMVFNADRFTGDSIIATIINDKSLLPPGNSEAVMPYIRADLVDLRNVHYNQQDLVNGFYMDIQAGRLNSSPLELNLPEERIVSNEFLLDSSTVEVRLSGRSAELAEQLADSLIDTDAPPAAKWYALANSLNLNDVRFIFDNQTAPRVQGLDFAHLDASGIDLQANDFYYTTDTIAAEIAHFTARDHSGFSVHELRTDFVYHPQGGQLRDLYLQTNNSILRDHVSFSYPSPEALTQNPGLMRLDVNLQNSVVGIRDLLFFAPQLANDPFFRKHREGKIRLDADVEGPLNDLALQRVAASGLGSTELIVSGRLQNMMEPARLSYDLDIQRLQSGRSDLEALLPPAALAQVRLPDRFGITGTLSGNTETFQPAVLIASTDGNAAVRGTISIAAGREYYDLRVRTQRLNLGKIIIPAAGVGIVTADLRAKGSGFDPKTMEATASGTVNAAVYNGTTYRNLNFDGSISGGIANVRLQADDPAANFDLVARLNFRGERIGIATTGTINSLDLQALGLYGSELKIQGRIHVDIIELDPDYPNGTVSIGNPVITLNGETYALDTLYVRSQPSSDSGNSILLAGDAIYAHVWGPTPLTRIPDILAYHVDRHYMLIGTQSETPLPPNYALNITARVDDHPVLLGFVPGLKSFDTLEIDGRITPELLTLDLGVSEAVYNTYTITGTDVQIRGDQAALTYDADIRRIRQKTMDIWFTHADGQIRNSLIDANLSIADADSVQKFRLYGTMQQEGDHHVVQLQRGLMLNYEVWNVLEPNRIVFGPEGFYVENFGMSNGPEQIRINSTSATFNAPIEARFSNFLLSNVTNIISGDTLLADGVINGEATLQNWESNLAVTADMNIRDLSVRGDTIGQVALQVHNATPEAIDARARITGYGNNVTLNGQYYPTAVDGNNFDMQVNLDPLNVATLEGAALNQIRNTTGYLRGQLTLQGTMAEPIITGTLQTDSLSTNIAALNIQFRMPDETLRFSGQTVTLDDFQIYDPQGNAANIDGSVQFASLSNPVVALRLNAENWQAMNSTPQDNELFYGQLFLSTNIVIDGPLTAPSIDGSVTVLENTSMTVVIPQYEAGRQEREGIVRFVDMNDPNRPEMFPPPPPKDTIERFAVAPGADINLNISTDESAEFNLLIDPGAGDFVKVRGIADLNTSVSPDGTLGVVGTYEIVDGSYHFNYNFIRRLFTIQPGSRIVFAGEPLEAEVDATAVYEANVPPYELVARQISDPASLIYYQQRLPFEVQLQLQGEIMQPEILFDIVLPEEKNYRVAADVEDVVRARLSQIRQTPSEMNKQVFSLIILNRFVGDNIFESGVESGGLENIARQSLSRFVSEQLNEIAGGLIGGLDLTMDLTTSEDFTTGERRNRTDLSVGASKRLLDDRLTVTVGNNFQVEGPQTPNRNSSLIPGNLAIDYDLSRDRSYQIRIFRRNEDLGVFEGYVVETGASFIMQRDYNRLNQLFMGARRKERMREERIRQAGAAGGNAGNPPADSSYEQHASFIGPKREETDLN